MEKAYIALGSIGALGFFYLLLGKRKEKSILSANWEEDVVYLYQFYRFKCVASISPFALKLESWLRLKKIAYQGAKGNYFSKGGRQSPFVELNGKEIYDTNVIIPTLEKHFHLQAEQFESEETKGGAHALMRMLDQHTVYSYFWYRYYEHWDEFSQFWNFPLPNYVKFFMNWAMPRGTKKKAWTVGHGRLTTDQIYQLGMTDLQALSDFLGSKRYLCGDELKTADCAAFGHLCQILYIPLRHPFKPYIEKNCPNLIHYAERVKAELWPDWDQICGEGW